MEKKKKNIQDILKSKKTKLVKLLKQTGTYTEPMRATIADLGVQEYDAWIEKVEEWVREDRSAMLQLRLKYPDSWKKYEDFFRKSRKISGRGLYASEVSELEEVINAFEAFNLDTAEFGNTNDLANRIASIVGIEFDGTSSPEEFITNVVEEFNREYMRDILVNNCVEVVKAPMSAVEYKYNPLLSSANKMECYLNVDGCSTLKPNEVSLEKNSAVRRVLTADNGFYREMRLFKKLKQSESLTLVLLDLGATPENDSTGTANKLQALDAYTGMSKAELHEAVSESLNMRKDAIFRNGLEVISEGKMEHYHWCYRNPSMTRRGYSAFAPMNGYDEVFDFWFHVTGTGNLEGFVNAFGERPVLSKLLTRVCSRSSASIDFSAVNEKLSEELEGTNVLYVKDDAATVITKRPVVTIDADTPDTLTEPLEKERELVLADGQALGHITLMASISRAGGRITQHELDRFYILWMSYISKGGNVFRLTKDIHQAKGDEFTELCELKRIIGKISPAQFRNGACKGMLFPCDLKSIGKTSVTYGEICMDGCIPEGHTPTDTVNMSEYDLVIPESVRKFMDAGFNRYPLEILHLMGSHKGMVEMNTQFMSSFDPSVDPNLWVDIAREILDQMEEALYDQSKAMQFHKLYGEDTNTGTLVQRAIRTSKVLLSESRIGGLRRKQYLNLIRNLEYGRVPVPGFYTYLCQDPHGYLNVLLKLTGDQKLPELNTGETYVNNHSGYACVQRSPLIHPGETYRARCTASESHWYLSDLIVMNVYDGKWQNLGGADFDGDKASCILDNTDTGDRICAAIREYPYDIYEDGLKSSGEKPKFVPNADDEESMENLISFLVQSSKKDRTGLITNYALKFLEISNHLKALVHAAEARGIGVIRFEDPSLHEKEDFWCFQKPVLNKERTTLVTRGFIPGNIQFAYDELGNKKRIIKISWNRTPKLNQAHFVFVGDKTLKEVTEYADYLLKLVGVLRLLQGREIDGAKTGIYAEGIRFDPDFTEVVKCMYTSHNIMNRQVMQGRRTAESFKDNINVFYSMSPWGRLAEYVHKRMYTGKFDRHGNEIPKEDSLVGKLQPERFSNKVSVLWECLDNAELKVAEDPKVQKRVERMLTRFKEDREEYINALKYDMELDGKSTGAIVMDSSESMSTSLSDFDAYWTDKLIKYAEKRNYNLEGFAALVYKVTYANSSADNYANVFAWLLDDIILKLFSRATGTGRWYPISKDATQARLRDGILYSVNKDGKARSERYVLDGDANPNLPITVSDKGNKFAWVIINPEKTIVPQKTGVDSATINVIGIKYTDALTGRGFMDTVSHNYYNLTIVRETKDGEYLNRCFVEVNDKRIGMVKDDFLRREDDASIYLSLPGTYHVVNPFDCTVEKSSISNLELTLLDS